MVVHPVKSIPFNANEFPEPDTRPVCLFVGIFVNTVYNSKYMAQGFEQAGYRVEIMDYQAIKFNEGVEMLQSLLVAKAMKEEPALIFLHIQTEGILNPVIVNQLNEIAPTVLYNFDCRDKAKMQWIYELMPYLTLGCFSNLEDVQICGNLGYQNAMVLQSSADYEYYRKLEKSERDELLMSEKYPHDIVFIGNRYDNTNMEFPRAKERTEMVAYLKERFGNKFCSYGMGFSKLVNQDEERLIYNNAKIAITHNNFYRVDYCSDRVYRSMGCGCFTIQQHYPNINQYFNNKVTSTWLNFEMLGDEIEKYLADNKLREAKAAAGFDFVREHHNWYKRVLQIQETLKKQKNGSNENKETDQIASS